MERGGGGLLRGGVGAVEAVAWVVKSCLRLGTEYQTSGDASIGVGARCRRCGRGVTGYHACSCLCAALFVPSRTMGNLIAIMIWCSARGSSFICGEKSHIFLCEEGGAAQVGPSHMQIR